MDEKPAGMGKYRGKIVEDGKLKECLLLNATQLCSSFFSEKDILRLRHTNKRIENTVESQVWPEKNMDIFKKSIENGKIHALERCVKEYGLDINSHCIVENPFGHTYHYYTPLFKTLEKEIYKLYNDTNKAVSLELIKELLRLGANPNTFNEPLYKEKQYINPLPRIIEKNPTNLFELFDELIKHGLNINNIYTYCDVYEYTFLHKAIQNLNIELFNYFLEKGADKELRINTGQRAVEVAMIVYFEIKNQNCGKDVEKHHKKNKDLGIIKKMMNKLMEGIERVG